MSRLRQGLRCKKCHQPTFSIGERGTVLGRLDADQFWCWQMMQTRSQLELYRNRKEEVIGSADGEEDKKSATHGRTRLFGDAMGCDPSCQALQVPYGAVEEVSASPAG